MLKSYTAFFKVELKSLMREPISLFFMIVLPVILTIVFGGAFGDEPTNYRYDVLGIDTVVPVNIVFLLANVGLMGIPITIAELKEQEVLKRYITCPINYKTYFLSLMSAFLFVSFLSTMLFSIVSFVAYNATWHMNSVDFILLILLSLIMIIVFNSMGFLIALLIKSSRSSNMISSAVFLILIFTSGVTMPVDHLPVYVQSMARILPMHHFIQLTQMLWISEFNIFDLREHLLYAAVVTVIFIIFLGKVKVKWD